MNLLVYVVSCCWKERWFCSIYDELDLDSVSRDRIYSTENREQLSAPCQHATIFYVRFSLPSNTLFRSVTIAPWPITNWNQLEPTISMRFLSVVQAARLQSITPARFVASSGHLRLALQSNEEFWPLKSFECKRWVFSNIQRADRATATATNAF